MIHRLIPLTFVVTAIFPAAAVAGSIADDLKAIRSVNRRGAGHDAAKAAWRRLAKADVRELPTILAAMDSAGPLATNWLRASGDAIVERQLRDGRPMPIPQLKQFLLDRSHGPRPRRLAFEWIVRVAPERRRPLLEKMLDDPSLELRYDAVQMLIETAKDAATEDDQRAIYHRALEASRDISQINACAEALEGIGVEIDLVKHLGLITAWNVIGPFDNTGDTGFDFPYPPENTIDFEATYEGKAGSVSWRKIVTQEDLGVVDLNKQLDKHKGAIVYAATEFVSDLDRQGQIRLGCINATKLWLNGEQVDANHVYHAAMDLDQYITDVDLKKGKNVILLKICQNEQTEAWAQDWKFQLRVTDSLGHAIRPDRSGTPPNDAKE